MSIFSINPYTIATDNLNKDQMRYCESITSVTNGYFGIRGNFEETYSGDSLKGTYIAGVWYPDKTKVGWWKNGYPEYFGKVINTVNLIGIRVFVEDEEIDLAKQQVADFSLRLDMRTAILERCATVLTHAGNVEIHSERFLSSSNKNLCAIRYCVKPLDKDMQVTIVPYLDFNVTNEDANYEEVFWDFDCAEAYEGGGYAQGTTKKNAFNSNRFSVGAAMRFEPIGAYDSIEHSGSTGYAEQKITFAAKKGACVGLKKYISVHAENNSDKKLIKIAKQFADDAFKSGYEELKQAHIKIFGKMIDDCDVQIEGDDSAQQGIRYNMFQLLSTYDGSNPALNIGPKGMTGEKYGGGAYWDTEAFLIPFYLGIRDKSVAKNLLLFRFNTLGKAVENAGKLGLEGALYPMVTFDGIECHNEWEITFEEIHRNGAIVYAIYNYVTYTDDTSYLADYGFSVLLQIARFWQDRVHYNQAKDVYMIHGVTGPNEYENNVNNNWYTNYIAKWCLHYTASVARKYKEPSQYSSEEIDRFEEVACKMYLPYDLDRDIAIQHDTFLDKELKGANTLEESDRPLYQNWSWDRILRSCYIKQADVVHGLYLFGHQLDEDFVRNSFEFYEPMTVHESSLSASLHSVVASRIGKKDKAYELYNRTVRLDLDNINNDTCDGLHITSMSGAWLAITQGFAGMSTVTGELKFDPYLPSQLNLYAFKIHYRGRLLKVEVSSEGVKITKLSGKDIELKIYDQKRNLTDCICEQLRS